ncbi:MAG TPA: hypothetical protein PK648_07205 [Verrucomicrobiales bacterium]|nr:hypothetical protein [Verrucomicrobiales bacterium]
METAPKSGHYHSRTEPGKWDATKTAIVICDIWDDHHCRNSEGVGDISNPIGNPMR